MDFIAISAFQGTPPVFPQLQPRFYIGAWFLAQLRIVTGQSPVDSPTRCEATQAHGRAHCEGSEQSNHNFHPYLCYDTTTMTTLTTMTNADNTALSFCWSQQQCTISGACDRLDD
jgi:hypothetical protein